MVVVLGLLRRKEQRRLSERNRNQKRRDKKGRILRNGESQRADGRYAFVYTDCFGKQKFLYGSFMCSASWYMYGIYYSFNEILAYDNNLFH